MIRDLQNERKDGRAIKLDDSSVIESIANDIDKASIAEIKTVINNNIEALGYIEHNRWNMEKLLLGFRKPHTEEQTEIDECRMVLSDNDKQSKHKYYKIFHKCRI